MRPLALASVLATLVACDRPAGNPACGITALAGATMLLDQFTVPGQSLLSAPQPPPEVLPVRLAAGPAFRGLVRTVGDSSWIVSVEGELPPETVPRFGVVVVGGDGRPRGVMLYTLPQVRGAPAVGSVTIGELVLPLLALQTDVSGLEDPMCPFFPDSLSRP